MLGIVLQKGEDKLLGALSLQKCKDFTVYLPESVPAEADYEADLKFRHGGWRQVQEPLTCILETGALPGPDFVGQVLRTATKHPDFAVYHVNLVGHKPFPKKADAKKIFNLTIVDRLEAPLSSFVFQSYALRDKAVTLADGSIDPFPTILSCAPIRNVCCLKLPWTATEKRIDPAADEKSIREKLDTLRWTEGYFGDDDYPLSVGDQLKIICRELAQLYPSYTADELKERLYEFEVTQKPIRRLRASCILKRAIREREKELKQQ